MQHRIFPGPHMGCGERSVPWLPRGAEAVGVLGDPFDITWGFR